MEFTLLSINLTLAYQQIVRVIYRSHGRILSFYKGLKPRDGNTS